MNPVVMSPAGDMHNDSFLTRFCWGTVERLSKVLEPDERDAVLGDLAECGARGARALFDLLGLVMRRQAGAWTNWRPWLGLFGMVGPIAVLLGQHTVGLGGALAAYWFYRVPLEADLVGNSLLLLAWAAASGFVVGSLSRRTIWTNATIFYLIWFFELLFGLRTVINIYPMTPYYQLAGYIYRTQLLPLALLPQLVLSVLPSMWGMARGFRLSRARKGLTHSLAAAGAIQILLCALIGLWLVAALKALDAPEPALYWRNVPHWHMWVWTYGPTIVILWPIAYILATRNTTHSEDPMLSS